MEAIGAAFTQRRLILMNTETSVFDATADYQRDAVFTLGCFTTVPAEVDYACGMWVWLWWQTLQVHHNVM